MIQPIGAIYTDNFYTMRNNYFSKESTPRSTSPPEAKNNVTDIIDLSPEAKAVIENLKNE